MNKSNPVNVSYSTARDRLEGSLRSRVVPFDRFYTIWSFVHATLLVALVALAELTTVRLVALSMLTVWSIGAIAILFGAAARLHPDGPGPILPNALTGSRVVAATLIVGLTATSVTVPSLATALSGPAGWILPGILLLVELTDYFDGRIARRLNAGAFGSIWDMENDVVYALALSILHRHVFGLTAVVLLIGLMRPLYVLLWRRPSRPARIPRAYTLYAKTTAASLTTILIVATVPVIGTPIRTAMVVVALAMQVVSFAWDLVLQRRR